MDKIYVLKLSNDKWFVGRTANVEQRFEQHMKGEGCNWTSLHTPMNIHGIIDIVTDDDEDRITREYMKQFGIYNVRGGKYDTLEYKPCDIQEIKEDMAEDEKKQKQKVKQNEKQERAKETIKKIDESIHKVTNELFNPESHLRSGRWFSKMLGR